MKPIVVWVLIADGTRARIVEQKGSGHPLTEVPGAEFSDENLENRDIQADRPGRSFDSAGEGRHAMEPPSDPKEVRQKQFLDSLAASLDSHLKQGKFDRLVIVAPPAALGHLRGALSDGAKKFVSAEVPKDLTKVPNPELASHLSDVLNA